MMNGVDMHGNLRHRLLAGNHPGSGDLSYVDHIDISYLL